MKISGIKKMLVLAACFLAVASSYATTTGDLIFKTSGGAAGKGQVFNIDGSTPLAGSGFSAQIWGGFANNSATFTLLDPQNAGPQPFATGLAAGYTGVGGSFSPAGNDYIVPSSSGGQTYFYEVRAWDNSTGNSFATATIKGKSGVASLVLGGIDSNDTIFPPLLANNFTSFSLIPEPSVLALGVMGGMVLLFRRRK